MAVFNYSRKEINAKIVYYGPGFCGKTTNLQFIHEHLKPNQRGKMVSVATDEDVTLFFDFLPIELENVRGFKTRLHLYTVPGQVYYGATRRAVLTGADGIIFVADSQIERMEDNLLSLKELEQNLRHYGKEIETTPFIIQYNKRDLPNILPVEELNKKINYLNVPYFESVAVEGKGVFESLTMICRMVLKAIKDAVEARGSAAMASSASEATGADASRVERGISRPEPARASQGAAPARTLRPGKGVPQIETPRPAKIPSLAGAEPKGETSSIVGRSIISRILDRKKLEPSAKVDEEHKEKILAPKEKMRIFFGAEPRISSPNSLEIPLTLEIDGHRKPLSFILAIKFEQLEPKVD
jgi:signal recognition particle receptor subunit beta